MTDKEKQSLKIRLGQRLSTDRPEVMEIVKEEINKTPKTIADLLQRPKGEWAFDEKGCFCCDQCKKYPHDQYATTKFCPNCGAKMKG